MAKRPEINIEPSELLKTVPVFIVILIVLGIGATSWFTIEPEAKGVVLRLGKYDRTVEPGLHFKLPFALDQVYKVPVKRQLKMEFGFRSSKPGVRTQYSDESFEQEALMLSGDLNVAEVEWVTQYRISEPQLFLFKVRNIEGTFRVMNEAVVREIVGDHSINDVLTTGRNDIELMAKEELQELCKQYEMGIVVDQVILQDVNPPDPVKPSFNEVNQAQQEKERLINQARAEYNKVIPRARGEASQKIEEAEGYAVQRVNEALGEAERFNAVFAEYQKAPEVTRQRMYLETMNQVLNQLGRKIIMDEQATGVLPLLNLNEEGK